MPREVFRVLLCELLPLRYLTLRTLHADCLSIGIRCVAGATSRGFTFRNDTALLPLKTPEPASCLYTVRGAGGEPFFFFFGKGCVPVTHSCVRASCCHSSLPPFTAAHGNNPLGAPLYQFPAGLPEPCKRQSGTMWFFKSTVSLRRRSPLPALICGTLYSPVPDGRLKSISVPTELCFFEHYIKNLKAGCWEEARSREMGRRGGAQSPARWHCWPTKDRETQEVGGRKKALWDAEIPAEKKTGNLHGGKLKIINIFGPIWVWRMTTDLGPSKQKTRSDCSHFTIGSCS